MRIGLGAGVVVQWGGNRPNAVTETGTTRYLFRVREREAQVSLERLQDALGRLDDIAIGARRSQRRYSDPVASSTQPLGFELGGTPARLRSTTEINTVTTSFSPPDPGWERGSTAPVTLGGVYDGSQGDDTIRFRVFERSDSWRVDVQDSTNTRIDRFDVPFADPRGTVYPIANGLTFSIGDGTVEHGDRFTISVNANDPQTPDPDAPFDQVGAAGPNLEPGLAVTAGSFTVNGTQITVDASDSISSVLSKITANTDVEATYDVANETVVLTQTVNGPDHHVVVGNDTSGFLDAMKLTDAVEEPGQIGDIDALPIAQIPALSAVTSGVLTIDGVSVALDVNQDTLFDVLGRIQTTVPGVTASYVRSRDTVVIRGSGRALEIDDGGTGFFDALYIPEGLYEGVAKSERGLASRDRRELVREVADVVAFLNEVLRVHRRESRLLVGLAASATDLIAARAEDGFAVLGIGTGGRELELTFTETGARQLDRALRDDPDSIMHVLHGSGEGSVGLLAELDVMTTAALSILEL